MNVLGEKVKIIHQHPLYVSNAALKANRDIIKIHRTMKDIVLSDSEEELNKNIKIIETTDARVMNELNIIQQRIIGEEGKNLEKEVRQLYLEWKPIRDELISYKRNGNFNAAKTITKSKSFYHVRLLEAKMVNLNEYARNKANYFLKEAEITKKSVHNTFFWSIIVMAFISIIVAVLLAFSILSDIKPILSSMKSASNSGTLQQVKYSGSNEITAMADSYNILVEKLLAKEKTLTTAYNELETLNEKLKLVDSHKNKFLTTMSHELRTPLNAILGYSQSLKHNYAGELNEKQKEYINIVIQSGEHLLALINDILDIAKIDADSMPITFEIVSPHKLVDETISYMMPQFQVKEISLTYTIPPELHSFTTDRKRCKQVLLNLLTNALKYTPDGGKVHVDVKRVNESLTFSVIDNGIGIKEEDLDLVFTEFYQSDQTRDQALGGTGIGLALCKRLIKLLKGKISVESKENEGSIFSFTLPIKQF